MCLPYFSSRTPTTCLCEYVFNGQNQINWAHCLHPVSPRSNRFANTRFGRTSTSELATVSVFSGEPRTYSTASVAAPNRFKSYRNRAAASSTRTNPVTEPSSYTRRGYKPRANNNPEGIINPAPSSAPPTINKFKLNRPAGRWQYKTSPKPRVTIRQQQNAPVKATTDSDLVSYCLLPPSLLFSPLVYALALCGVFVSVWEARRRAQEIMSERWPEGRRNAAALSAIIGKCTR